MNFLKIIRWIVILCICVNQTTNLDAAANQVNLFNGFAVGSWKAHNVRVHGHGQNTSMEQYLAEIFNTEAWGPGGSATQIAPPIAALVAVCDYYQQVVNPVGWIDALANNHSPRKWMRELNLREIYRFKELVTANPNLINNNNYATDDLVKARSLSGTFWEVDTTLVNPIDAEPIFSGMLVPGQDLTNPTYQVYTDSVVAMQLIISHITLSLMALLSVMIQRLLIMLLLEGLE